MSKPGFREAKSSPEIDRFTDRDDLRARFRKLVHSVDEPPVLMFYGIGGTGKTWLLKKLREETPRDIPTAFLDFAVESGGQRFVLDPSFALQEIRLQLGKPAPRFDIAMGMMRFKQRLGSEPSPYSEGIGLALELAAEIGKKAVEIVPGGNLAGANILVGRLSKALWARIKDLPIGEFLSTRLGSEFALQLNSQTSQEIGNELLYYLTNDLRDSLPVHFNRAARAVLFLDTYEAVGAGLANNVHKRLREQWILDVAANFDFALTVIAGQNKLTWEKENASWADSLEQHPVGGLAEPDARQFLSLSGIEDPDLQAAILRTAYEPDEGGYRSRLPAGLGCNAEPRGRTVIVDILTLYRTG
jgi:hypothetical protein